MLHWISICLCSVHFLQPTVYVAETAISSGSAGSSADGAENTVAIVAGLGLISVAAASSVLLMVGKSEPQVQTPEYSGPALSYYIDKFRSPEIIQASAPSLVEPVASVAQPESLEPEVSQVQPTSDAQPVDST